MAWVKTATIPDRLGPNDRTSDGEEGAGFKEGRQRRQRLCARDHGKEQQYEFSFSILNIWRLYHENMICICCCRPTKKNLWDPRKPSWGESFICSGFQGRHKFESFRVKRFFSSSSSNILPQVLRQYDHVVSGWLLQSIWPELHRRRPFPIACRRG